MPYRDFEHNPTCNLLLIVHDEALGALMRFNLDAYKLSHLLYLSIVLLIAFLLLISGVFLLSQAVRTSPNRAWSRNVNALVIGASYVLVVCPHMSKLKE